MGCIHSFTSAMSLKLHFLMALTKLDAEAKALHGACHHAETMLNSIRHGSRFINVLAGAVRVSEQCAQGQ